MESKEFYMIMFYIAVVIIYFLGWCLMKVVEEKRRKKLISDISYECKVLSDKIEEREIMRNDEQTIKYVESVLKGIIINSDKIKDIVFSIRNIQKKFDIYELDKIITLISKADNKEILGFNNLLENIYRKKDKL